MYARSEGLVAILAIFRVRNATVTIQQQDFSMLSDRQTLM